MKRRGEVTYAEHGRFTVAAPWPSPFKPAMIINSDSNPDGFKEGDRIEITLTRSEEPSQP